MAHSEAEIVVGIREIVDEVASTRRPTLTRNTRLSSDLDLSPDELSRVRREIERRFHISLEPDTDSIGDLIGRIQARQGATW